MMHQNLAPYTQRKLNDKSDETKLPATKFNSLSSYDETTTLTGELAEKHKDIMGRFGAAEYVYDEDRNVIDIISPEEYFEETDQKIRCLLRQGEVDDSLVPTSSLLCQLARAEVSYLESYTSQLRNDPAFVQELIRSAAELRTELIPDKNGKTIAKLQDMLKNADYLSHEIRTLFHDSLLELGQWCLVVHHLDDLVRLEERVGYVKAQSERDDLKDNARSIVEQAMGRIASRISKSIRKLKEFERFWTRVNDPQEKWGECRADCVYNKETEAIFDTESLYGCLFRFSLSGDEDFQLPSIHQLTEYFKHASQQELDGLGLHLVEDLSKLQAVFDFYKVLGFTDQEKSFRKKKETKDLDENASAAMKVLRAAAIERRVKNISTLGTESVLDKIWKEIDGLTPKKEHKTLEKLIGYEKPIPRWFIAPRSSRPARPSSPPKTVVDILTRPSRVDTACTSPRVEPLPANIAPVLYGGVSTASDAADVPPVRTREKVKTTGVAAPPTPAPPTDPANKDEETPA
ncbi:hypothetical protein CPC08DRAFT_768265 [Agrocybe pediades]|nr:hypothetical protein CPC08DRAFT_768265 [Agrocybe pediades]